MDFLFQLNSSFSFRLLTGKPPFWASEANEFIKLVEKAEVTYPDHVSEDARDLISKFLKVNSDERISLAAARQHPWTLGPKLQHTLIRRKVTLFDSTIFLILFSLIN